MSTHQCPGHPIPLKQSFFPAIFLGAALASIALAGCNKNSAVNPDGIAANVSDPNAQDPTFANMAPVDSTGPSPQEAPVALTAQSPTRVAGYQRQAQPTQQGYTTPAPVERRAPSTDQYADQGPDSNSDSNYDSNYEDAEAGYNATLADVSAPQPPPPLPTYEQPEAPQANYLWTPGYWNYAPQGYYWVPGAWVQPPYTGALWTPGYWGGYGPGYRFHRGFWAPHIGFYGGINYGFGYFGSGYQGGYWNGDDFYYNRECNRVNDRVVRNVYKRNVVINNTVINNTTVNNIRYNNVSYNGGRGGVEVRPRPAEIAVLREQRVPPMQAQIQHQREAEQNRQQFFALNQGRPAQIALARPLPADRGIAAPIHTTAQLNRALPVAQQIRQEQQFVRPATSGKSVDRPTNQPIAARPNVPNPSLVNQPQRPPIVRQQPTQQNRPDGLNQPNRPVQQLPVQQAPGAAQTQSHSGEPLLRPTDQSQRLTEQREQREARPQPQQLPMRQVPPQQQTRPQPQPALRPAPQQQPGPVQTVRPQPEFRQQGQPSGPQPASPQPAVQQPRPQVQAQQPRPQVQVQQPRPQVQAQQVRPQPQAQSAHPQQQGPRPQQASQPHPAPHARP